MARRAEFEGPLEGGGGVNLISDRSLRVLKANGFFEEEFIASGSAVSYRATGDLGFDGRWDAAEDESAEFRTRVVVRRPVDPSSFNGTVLVEWHNVSAGTDTAPDWTYLAAEILRRGYAWIGVSAQRVGVVGAHRPSGSATAAASSVLIQSVTARSSIPAMRSRTTSTHRWLAGSSAGEQSSAVWCRNG